MSDTPAQPEPAADTDATPSDHGSEPTLYDQMGGETFFRSLVAAFYQRVADDELLRPMYPEEDLGPAEDRLRWFLEQYWGGPKTYGEKRGHPMLRRRHMPFAVTPTARDHWLQHMGEALAEQDLAEPLRTQLWDYLVYAAGFLVNAADEDAS